MEFNIGPDWLTFDGLTLSGQVPLDADPGELAITLTASDQEFNVEQPLTLTIAERDTTLVAVSTTAAYLPSPMKPLR